MSIDFPAAMSRAAESVRAQNLDEATRIIQEALGRNRAATPPQGGEARPRRPLAETLATLREGSARFAGLGTGAGAGADAPPPIPEGAAYEWRAYSSPAGSRRYRLYVPASASARPRGLILMLHGCTQNPDDFATGTAMNAIAEAHGLAVAYPEQTRAQNPQSCWRWFEPAHQRREAGEPAILASLARAVVADHGIDPGRVFVAGLSAGGAMAAVLGETYPDLFAAVGVHSGLAPGAARDVASAFAAMRGELGAARPRPAGGKTVPTIVFHGLADRTVHPKNADRVMAAVEGEAATTSLSTPGRSAGGRAYERTLVATRDGATLAECWRIEGLGHAWSGGRAGGSYVDPAGPDASAEMVRFFLSVGERGR